MSTLTRESSTRRKFIGKIKGSFISPTRYGSINCAQRSENGGQSRDERNYP